MNTAQTVLANINFFNETVDFQLVVSQLFESTIFLDVLQGIVPYIVAAVGYFIFTAFFIYVIAATFSWFIGGLFSLIRFRF